MSDEEEEYDFAYSDDDQEETDVEIENAYYAAKGDKATDVEAALEGFRQVVSLEGARGERGEWGFKALKQTVKLLFAMGRHEEMLARYVELLDYATAPVPSSSSGPSTSSSPAAAVAPAVTQNVAEKGIDSILDHVSSSSNLPLLHALYDTTLDRLGGDAGAGAGAGPAAGRRRNERLWFKTNLKLAHLLLQEIAHQQQLQLQLQPQGTATDATAAAAAAAAAMDVSTGGEDKALSASASGSGLGLGLSQASLAMGRLQRVVKELLRCCEASRQGGLEDVEGADVIKRGTQLLEVYALQMQLHALRRDSRKLRELYHQALRITWGVPHPRTLGVLQECGGKMYMGERDYDQAIQAFFQSFKCYDEAGEPRRLAVLKYLVLAAMLHRSTIDPFDSQEAKPYKDDKEIVAMRTLIEAFQRDDVKTFERILKVHRASLLGDDFIRAHIDELLRTVRTQVLVKAIAPYDRVSLRHLAAELNHISEAEVEELLVALILDGRIHAYIDQLQRTLVRHGSGQQAGGRYYVPSEGAGITTPAAAAAASGAANAPPIGEAGPAAPSSMAVSAAGLAAAGRAKEQYYRSIGRLADALRGVVGERIANRGFPALVGAGTTTGSSSSSSTAGGGGGGGGGFW